MIKQNNEDLKYILNEKNKLITYEFIENLMAKFNIELKIENIGVFQEAMIHISYLIRDENFYKNNKTKPYQIQSNDIEPLDDISKAIPLQKKSYERLEFLGDSILHSVFADYLFTRYDNVDEGFMTKLRTKIENGNTLSILSRKVGLNEYVMISRYVEKNGGRETNENILEDVFEAFIGALFLEVGFDICKKFLTTLIEKEIDLAQLLYQETNFKERLLQYFHLRKWADPIYGCLDVSGPENKKMYTMYVKCRKSLQDEGEIVGIASSSAKKKAEQLSAKAAMEHFGVYKESNGDDYDDIIEELSESDSSLDEYESESEDEMKKNKKELSNTKSFCKIKK
jgi:dsRNA-specific ribonuclease